MNKLKYLHRKIIKDKQVKKIQSNHWIDTRKIKIKTNNNQELSPNMNILMLFFIKIWTFILQMTLDNHYDSLMSSPHNIQTYVCYYLVIIVIVVVVVETNPKNVAFNSCRQF